MYPLSFFCNKGILLDMSETEIQNNKQKKTSLLNSGLKLSLLTLISRVLGLIREMTKAAFLGTSNLADAFGIAFMIPNLFRRLFAENSISVAFIPTFKKYLENQTQDPTKKTETQDFINATFTLVTFVTTITVTLGIIFSPVIVQFFAKDDATAILPEMAFLTRIMFPYLMVISIAALFQGILNGHKIFSPSGFTPILFNIIVIGATYLLSPLCKNPARAMAYGVLFGGIVQTLFQLPFVLQQNWKISFTSLKKTFSNPGTKKVLLLIGPTIIGMAAYQLNDVVSTALAGRAGEGIVSSLQYSLRLQELILGIFAVSIGTVILPDLSSLSARQDWEGFNSMLTQSVKIIALITIPIMFFSLLIGENLITLIYKNKNFTDQSVALTLEAFKYHISGLFFIAVNRIVSPAFYAQGNTKLPTLAGILGFVLNIIFALILVKPMSGGGIALALSLASFGNTIFLFIFLKKTKVQKIGKSVSYICFYSIKLIVFSVISAIPLFFCKSGIFAPFSHLSRFLAQGIPLVISAVLYFFILFVLLVITKDSLSKTITTKITKKFIKKN